MYTLCSALTYEVRSSTIELWCYLMHLLGLISCRLVAALFAGVSGFHTSLSSEYSCIKLLLFSKKKITFTTWEIKYPIFLDSANIPRSNSFKLCPRLSLPFLSITSNTRVIQPYSLLHVKEVEITQNIVVSSVLVLALIVNL